MARPYSGAGGFSANHGSWRMNSPTFQFTEAIMLRPMISNARKPLSSERTPVQPRCMGPIWAFPIRPIQWTKPGWPMRHGSMSVVSAPISG